MSPDLFLVGTLGGAVVAPAMVGHEGRRGRISHLGARPEYQRRGHSSRMMEEAERLLPQGGAAINLQVRSTNVAALAFSARLGFARDEVVGLGKRLERDSMCI